ncbi:MAG: hypothetical protein AAF443_08450 [Chlamydiota bacterium]
MATSIKNSVESNLQIPYAQLAQMCFIRKDDKEKISEMLKRYIFYPLNAKDQAVYLLNDHKVVYGYSGDYLKHRYPNVHSTICTFFSYLDPTVKPKLITFLVEVILNKEDISFQIKFLFYLVKKHHNNINLTELIDALEKIAFEGKFDDFSRASISSKLKNYDKFNDTRVNNLCAVILGYNELNNKDNSDELKLIKKIYELSPDSGIVKKQNSSYKLTDQGKEFLRLTKLEIMEHRPLQRLAITTFLRGY